MVPALVVNVEGLPVGKKCLNGSQGPTPDLMRLAVEGNHACRCGMLRLERGEVVSSLEIPEPVFPSPPFAQARDLESLGNHLGVVRNF